MSDRVEDCSLIGDGQTTVPRQLKRFHRLRTPPANGAGRDTG
jgi:hypothetical protein